MSATHVIILAQGQQKRLPALTLPKQLLPLPACGEVPIIHRTLCQLAKLDPAALVTVVCGAPIALDFYATGEKLVRDKTGAQHRISMFQLPDPGNSSLKGIVRYLDACTNVPVMFDGEPVHFDKWVVLLGDVIYSWECLRACLLPTNWNLGFVGTSDLSRSGGELWGLCWNEDGRHAMLEALMLAYANHPPFEEYQPGQMRRWLWEIDKHIDGPFAGQVPGEMRRTWFSAIDDYTRDIDLPEHVRELGRLSELAATDDRAHGLVWRDPR